MRNLFIAWTVDHNVFEAFIAEIENIGNEEINDVISVSSSDNDFLAMFEDDNYIQWDTTVTYIDWSRVDKDWRAYYENSKRTLNE